MRLKGNIDMYKIDTIYARKNCIFEIKSLAGTIYGVYYFDTRWNLIFKGTLRKCRDKLKCLMETKYINEFIKQYESEEF